MLKPQPDVLVDLCVQREYVTDSGVTRCANAEHIERNLRHLMAFARWAGLPVLSCVDSYRPNQIGDTRVAINRNGSPVHQKPGFSVLPRHTVIDSDNYICVPLDVFSSHQQAIFTKVHRDPFTNPKLDRLLTEMRAGTFVVFGMPLESSLRMLVLGLIRRNRRVTLLHDACGFFSEQDAAMTLRQLRVKGCEVLSTLEYVSAEFERRAACNRRNGRVRRSGLRNRSVA